MNKPRIVLTGGTGFIGSNLLRRLASTDMQVLALTRHIPRDLQADNIEFYLCDLNNPDTYADRLKCFCPEVAIHLAWTGIPDYSLATSLINVNSSLSLFDQLLEQESCSKIIAPGSCWEFNQTKGECLESDSGTIKDHFTWAKHSIRNWLEVMCKRVKVSFIWPRVFYAYGPGQRHEALIPSLLNSFRKSQSPPIRHVANSNDYIYIDDLVDAFVKFVTKDIKPGLYNLGSGKATSVLEVCRLAEEIVLGTSSHTELLEMNRDVAKANTNFWAQINATTKQLEWNPKTTLRQGIYQTWQHMQSDVEQRPGATIV